MYISHLTDNKTIELGLEPSSFLCAQKKPEDESSSRTMVIKYDRLFPPDKGQLP